MSNFALTNNHILVLVFAISKWFSNQKIIFVVVGKLNGEIKLIPRGLYGRGKIILRILIPSWSPTSDWSLHHIYLLVLSTLDWIFFNKYELTVVKRKVWSNVTTALITINSITSKGELKTNPCVQKRLIIHCTPLWSHHPF